MPKKQKGIILARADSWVGTRFGLKKRETPTIIRELHKGKAVGRPALKFFELPENAEESAAVIQFLESNKIKFKIRSPEKP